MLVALNALATLPRQIVVTGQLYQGATRGMLRKIGHRYLTNRTLLLADGGEGQREIARRLPYLTDIKPVDAQVTAYLCEDGVCRLPTNDPAALLAQL